MREGEAGVGIEGRGNGLDADRIFYYRNSSLLSVGGWIGCGHVSVRDDGIVKVGIPTCDAQE